MSADGRVRLRSLRLVGFKSFAERTALEFGPGISAVVGPNGSGKSNLADALRWALGEQGRQLRTRRSEDVIFAGSARRHATGMADVTLVLENDDRLLPVDFGEVAVGRRLYRSGENEYLLNGQRVRLRDLLDLLDGANLADNAFLFIGQGMVDQALSLRPEERRPLFEEAAGVRRHERRRRQAEAQLEEATANLARVRDILGELRPQARRLAAQAEQQVARAAAGDELAAALVASGRARWTGASSVMAQADRALVAARAATDGAMRDLVAAEEAAAEFLVQLDQRSLAGRQRRDALDAARSALTELRLAAARRDARAEAMEREGERLRSEQVAAADRLADARRALVEAAAAVDPGSRQAVAELRELERELARASAESARLETAHRAADEQAASVRRAEELRRAELAQLQRQVDAAARAADEARAAAESAATEVAKTSAASAELEAARVRRMAEETAAAKAVATTAEGLLAAEASQRSEVARIEGIEARRAALEARRAAVADELERDEMATLLRAARRHGGRPVADGLEVDPALRRAVEGALGPTLAAAAVARDRVTELQGRPGHLVLEDAGARASASAAERAHRAAVEVGGGPLEVAVRRDPLGLVRGLLATTVWVPDLAAALRVAAALPQGWQAVTREGELVRADGVVRLGSPAAPLARQGELERLAAELAATTGEASEAGERLREARARCDAAGAAAAGAAAALESARQERQILEADLRRAANASELAAREAAWAGAQASRLSDSLDRARAALAVAEGAEPAERGDRGAPAVGEADALGRWQARLESLEARRAALVAEDERLAAVAAAAADQRRRAELGIVAEEERLADVERRTRELETALAELERERATAATDLASARHAEAEAAAALAELDAGELTDRSRLAEAERTAATSRERLRGAEEAVRTAELAALQARVGLDAVREQVLVELAGLGELGLAALVHAAGDSTASSQAPAAAEAAGDGADEEAREAAVALQLEATLDVVLRGWADAEPTASAPAEAPSAGRLAALRRRYHEVGASNPFAAQEYAEVRARLEDLEAQQEDLDRAIAATRALIGELSERITRQFRDTFAALETAFARRFEQLFGGGEAQLVLTEPEDLAVTGVEIMARPPGKKRQALAMLSGGERALTAVALLFSMLDVRPVPFCVLDEVDAALDEANITRFTEALRDLAVATQFVVITHNRGTIEAADALYGITIGDDAVSRVISLRLAEATQLAEVG